ncbi:protection of telomeres protein 1a-like [Asparagus officinalis]|uniref:protection of telomeres protein 1a-like n=1 Tax=Asparagus officinalis TaxID=4686 RepID=UPI00098E0A75|nr:protection of telomeres protein 1a-like [Asparagus officinalis]
MSQAGFCSIGVKVHDGYVYFLFDSRTSSFALFRGKTGATLKPYQTSDNFIATDYVTVEKLRKLSLEQFDGAEENKDEDNEGNSIGCFCPPLITSVKSASSQKIFKIIPSAPTSLFLVQNIKVGESFDLVCKVVHVHEISEEEWMLFIWDGTDAPMTFQTNLDPVKENPSLLHSEPTSLSEETLSLFPCLGTVLRISTGKFFEDLDCFPVEGNWVKLYNVLCELQSDIWTGVMNSDSRIFILSDEDRNVKYRERVYGERVAFNIGQIPLSTSLDSACITGLASYKLKFCTSWFFVGGFLDPL